MESAPPIPIAPEAPTATLSPFERLIAVFVRPGQAWTGLETRGQWWFPLLLMIALNVTVVLTLWDRVMVPTQQAMIERMVESGRIPPDQAAVAMDRANNPAGKWQAIIGQVVSWPVIMLVAALITWIAMSFVLGVKFRYRLAFEVATWSSLVLFVDSVLRSTLAWFKGDITSIHLSLAALVPSDWNAPWARGLNAFLDLVSSPFAIWCLAVSVIGAATLSRMPARQVARGMIAVYLVYAVCAAGLAMLLASMFGA